MYPFLCLTYCLSFPVTYRHLASPGIAKEKTAVTEMTKHGHIGQFVFECYCLEKRLMCELR